VAATSVATVLRLNRPGGGGFHSGGFHSGGDSNIEVARGDVGLAARVCWSRATYSSMRMTS
jgi:hypothetical protein